MELPVEEHSFPEDAPTESEMPEGMTGEGGPA